MTISASDSVSPGGETRFDSSAIADGRRARHQDGAPATKLDPFAARVGARVGARSHHPAVATVEVVISAYVVLSVLMIAVGTVVSHWWAPSALGRWDESVNRWFAGHRTGLINHVTAAATFMADTGAVVGIALVAAVIMVILRRWRNALVLAVALLLEVTVFLSTTFTVARPRPAVPRLDSTPSTASFPSGHIAASLVLWAAVAFCVMTWRRQRVLAVLASCIAVVAPLTIGFARVYRGMHHVTDVVAGGCLGLGALTAALVAERATSVAIVVRGEHRRRRSVEPAVVEGARVKNRMEVAR
jgi:undecaprenyl-diphosphatase